MLGCRRRLPRATCGGHKLWWRIRPPHSKHCSVAGAREAWRLVAANQADSYFVVKFKTQTTYTEEGWEMNSFYYSCVAQPVGGFELGHLLGVWPPTRTRAGNFIYFFFDFPKIINKYFQTNSPNLYTCRHAIWRQEPNATWYGGSISQTYDVWS
jgi:hypothetical protein